MGNRGATLILLMILCFAVSSLVVLVNAEASWVLWSQTYGGAGYEGLLHDVFLVETSDGGYALFGDTYSFGAGRADFWLVKTDGSGNIEWNRTYGGASWDHASSLVQTSDGGFALAGDTNSFGNGGYDFWLVKTNEQGIPEFPSWIILPLLLVITLFAIIIKKRLLYPH